jgi:hypothetical protein
LIKSDFTLLTTLPKMVWNMLSAEPLAKPN